MLMSSLEIAVGECECNDRDDILFSNERDKSFLNVSTYAIMMERAYLFRNQLQAYSIRMYFYALVLFFFFCTLDFFLSTRLILF